MLDKQLPCVWTALTAIAAHTKALAQLPHGTNTLIEGSADIPIGNGTANANVHALDLRSSRVHPNTS